MKTMTLNLLFTLLISSTSWAHEGHNTPGVLPNAPHGGKVKEATAKGEKKSHSEIFFEAVFQDKKVTIYPLTLSADGKEFLPASKNTITQVTARFKFSKGEKKLPLTLNSDFYEGMIEMKDLNWLDVYISVLHDKKQKEAKIHFEFNG